MPSQSDLIGVHPIAPSIFAKWLSCNDIPVTATKSHRSLTPLIDNDDTELVEWLGKKLFDHHHSDYRIEKLKENYAKLGFTNYSKYIEEHRRLPEADRVKKGNFTEMLLVEYVENSLAKKLIKVYKLKYNPNVDQAIKGDDTLMVDALNEKGVDKVKLYLGESKFRQTPAPAIVRTIADSLSKDKLPLSFTFLIDELAKDAKMKKVADMLDSLILDEIKGRGDLIYVGMFLSNENTSSTVESHLNSDNTNLVVISIGVDDPESLIELAFDKANHLVQNPDQL